MKSFFIMLWALLVFSLSMSAGNPGVTFLLRSGQKVSFAFIEKPVVALSEANLSVKVQDVERVNFAYADVQRVMVVDDVDDDVVSGWHDIVTNGQSRHVIFSVYVNTLNVSGLAAQESLSFYAVDGKLVLSAKAVADGKAIVDLSVLQQGVYVVRTQSGISYKFFKK